MEFWHQHSQRAHQDRELDEEMQFHMAPEARLCEDRGEPTETARRNVRRYFDNYAAI